MTLGLAFGALTFGRLETDVQEGPGGESGIAMARDRATVEMVVLRRVIEDHVRGTGKLPQGPGWFAELSAPDPATGNPRYPALRNLASPEGLDPWGRAYELKVLPDGSFEIISYGKDGQPGGAGDAADIIDR
jgi:general secretion pathway protein G